MIGLYLMCLIFFPIAMLYKVEISNENKITSILMSKSDTQFLRGVSAWFVMIGHFCGWINEVRGDMNKLFYLVFSQLGGMGALIFFFVSGYGIYKSYADKVPSWDYLWKRVKSVYFPYLIIKFFIVILKFIIDGKITFGVHKLISILLAEEDWFIHVILIQYIVFFVIWKFLRNKHIILYSILADVIMSCVFVMEGKPDRWFNSLWLFTFGIVCSRYEKEVCNFFSKKTWIKTFLSFVLFTIIGTVFAVYKGIEWANVFKVLGGGFLCIAICGILRRFTFNSKSMLYFGKRSIYLYILHVHVWAALQIENVIYKFWVVLALSLLFSEVLYQFTEFFVRNKKRIKSL